MEIIGKIIREIIDWIRREIAFELWYRSPRTKGIYNSDERFAVLDNFADLGMINQDEYNEKFQEIWDEAAEKYDRERAEKQIRKARARG